MYLTVFMLFPLFTALSVDVSDCFPVVPPFCATVSIAFVEAKDWDNYRREQGLIAASMERILGKSDFYGLFNVRFSGVS